MPMVISRHFPIISWSKQSANCQSLTIGWSSPKRGTGGSNPLMDASEQCRKSLFSRVFGFSYMRWHEKALSLYEIKFYSKIWFLTMVECVGCSLYCFFIRRDTSLGNMSGCKNPFRTFRKLWRLVGTQIHSSLRVGWWGCFSGFW